MRELNFGEHEYAIFGGACLAAHDIRATTDLEIFVSSELYLHLLQQGWEERITGSTGAHYLTRDVQGVPVLVFVMCGSEQWCPDVSAYLRMPEIIDGLAYMPLKEMYAWKAATRRPKDLVDLTLIDSYWAASDVSSKTAYKA